MSDDRLVRKVVALFAELVGRVLLAVKEVWDGRKVGDSRIMQH